MAQPLQILGTMTLPQPETEIGFRKPEMGIQLFKQSRFDDFETLLDSIPSNERPITMKAILDIARQSEGHDFAMLVARRMSHHPRFKPLWKVMPCLWEQGIFVTNTPFLKSRVSVSFMEHSKIKRKHIDYGLNVYDQNGVKILEELGQLNVGETKTFEMEGRLPEGQQSYGLACLETVEKDLHSLRLYAQWYNDSSLTTTHEKGALANKSSYIIYPTIICDENIETYLAISNISPPGETPDLTIDCSLKNINNEWVSKNIQIKLAERKSLFVPISQCFQNAKHFLDGKPGSLYLKCNHKGGLYYYFIHNKKLNSWQVQHL